MKRRLPVPRAERLLNLYITLVCTAGLGLIVRLGPAGVRTAWHTPLVPGLSAAGAIGGEFARIDVQWRGKTFHYTMASPFTLAILALWGLPAALLAISLATLLDDGVHHSTLRKTLFNLGQASLALGAAGLVYALLADGPVTSWRQAPAFCAAAVLNLAVHQACRIATRERAARARAEANQFHAETAQTVAEKARAEAEAARADAERGRAEAERQAAARAQLLELARGLVRRLRTQDRHTSETIALVAHELREPLDRIASIVASLCDGDQRVAPAARQELLAAVLRHAEAASDAARRLLLDARHHRTQPTVTPAATVIDAAELLRRAGQLAAFLHDDRPVEVSASAPLAVRACPDAIDRILGLLLDNAVGHTRRTRRSGWRPPAATTRRCWRCKTTGRGSSPPTATGSSTSSPACTPANPQDLASACTSAAHWHGSKAASLRPSTPPATKVALGSS